MILTALLWLVLAVLVAYFAKKKNYNSIMAFIVAAILSPLLAFLIYLVMPAKEIAADITEEHCGDWWNKPKAPAKQYKFCGRCGEKLNEKYNYCPRCGHKFK